MTTPLVRNEENLQIFKCAQVMINMRKSHHFSKQITTATCTTASHTTLPHPPPRRKKYFHGKNQQSLTSTEQYINGDILRRDVIHYINHIFNCMVGLHDLSEIMIEMIFISTYMKIIFYLRSAAHAVR